MGLDIQRGCREGAKGSDGFDVIRIGTDTFDRCPKAWLRDECESVEPELRACAWMLGERGPPVLGGMEDQSLRFLVALDVADAAMSEALEWKRKLAENERKARGAHRRRGT